MNNNNNNRKSIEKDGSHTEVLTADWAALHNCSLQYHALLLTEVV